MNEHPDLDALSASLDGEDEGDVAAHVQGCASCAARLASLRVARDAVARPVVAPSPARREQFIAEALAAAGGWSVWGAGGGTAGSGGSGGGAGSGGGVGGGGAPVVAMPSRRWQWVAGSGIAAVLVLVVGMVALFGRGAGRERGTDTAASAAAPESTKSGVGGEAVTDGGNLGDIATLEALRARVRSATTPLAAAAGEATGNVTSRANAGAAPSADSAATPPVPVQVGTRVCEIEARTARPQVGVVVYAATATFQGKSAVVLGFAPTAGVPPTALLVLAPQEGCRLLGETTPS